MEKELYHENLEVLYDHFGHANPIASLYQVARFLKKDERTLKATKGFPLKKVGKRYHVPLAALARWMS